MRSKPFCALVAAIAGSAFGGADAAYVIKLKNGNEYVTTRYWQEGGQVLFDTYEGVFGIEKNFVIKIEKIDRPIRLANSAGHPQKDAPPNEPATPSQESAQKKEGESKTEKKRGPDDPIVGEFNRLVEKSKEVDRMLTGEIRTLLGEITTFKNKLARDSKLFIEYGREFNEAHQTAEVVEAALRARTQ